MSEILAHYLEILSDPAHSLVEFTFVALDMLVISRVSAGFRRVLKREHERIDAEHGVVHPEQPVCTCTHAKETPLIPTALTTHDIDA